MTVERSAGTWRWNVNQPITAGGNTSATTIDDDVPLEVVNSAAPNEPITAGEVTPPSARDEHQPEI